VLIVEDNKRSRKLARDLLQYQDFRTLEAEDAETRLRLAKDSLPNIILMDSELPGIDGVEALEHLRADPATAGIPVVAVSAELAASSGDALPA
jgi:two-component system cell cycle response regulator DivK